MNNIDTDTQAPTLHVDVIEYGESYSGLSNVCEIGTHIKFSSDQLSTYCFSNWEPILFDSLLVAAAVEFCDRSFVRKTHCWGRKFRVEIPVHEPAHWNSNSVKTALHDALSFLTGDKWNISFKKRRKDEPSPLQALLDLPSDVAAVIPYSDGMDSRAVAGLIGRIHGENIVRVRLGSIRSSTSGGVDQACPFAQIPYRVKTSIGADESSVRSRGFKFSTASALGAYLTGANEVVIPESGQGALGPALVPVGQTYEDYRNHPLFMDKMAVFFYELIGFRPNYTFPRLWSTKGETLNEFVTTCSDGPRWASTRSCWRDAREVSQANKLKQCGVCAACMLRRLSVHSARLREVDDTYICQDLSVHEFPSEKKSTKEYAIAGVLHLDYLAAFTSSKYSSSMLESFSFQLSKALDLTPEEITKNLTRMLSQHEIEWSEFIQSQGSSSFIRKWAIHAT